MKYTIEVDTTMHFNPDGMGGCVFLGDNDDGFEFDMTWDELIDREFEMQIIPGHDADVIAYQENGYNTVQEIYNLIENFENAAKKMRKRLENCLVLDRDAWLKANDGKYNQENRDKFLKYFSYDMVE